MTAARSLPALWPPTFARLAQRFVGSLALVGGAAPRGPFWSELRGTRDIPQRVSPLHASRQCTRRAVGAHARAHRRIGPDPARAHEPRRETNS